ncbi:HNH endonuclease signature motif containing protein [Pseudomonas sp. BGr12]|uniref:HNH endonuclease signature motif containing protein n=1 Tax=Pseudomonas sp. BGr12 TaxID=2936269 RepID=UPI002559FC79|nr:HNH endonuclease signature motif containing protein [Pseudomonas sp. BJa5]MDL2428482.1 HNH endonuclease [Pseudomonas sp. BJa5]
MLTKNRTELALIARGMDSALARRLRQQGWTLQKLQLQDAQQLAALGVTNEVIDEIHGDGRPPIPNEDLAKVLFDNRWVCCVCRDPLKPIVVHHIRLWSESRDHSPANLAVLCTQHHGEAHTSHGLEMSLAPERIRDQKGAWEELARTQDRLAIQQSTQYRECHWWYFNHLRLFDLARGAGVIFEELDGYEAAREKGLCDSNGIVIRGAGPMYGSGVGGALSRYMTSVLIAVLEHGMPRNVSDELDKGTMRALIVPGDLIYVQGLYRFTGIEGGAPGTDPVEGVRTVNGVVIKFVFDRNEGTSESARHGWLCGSKPLGALLRVVHMERDSDGIVISATVLAIRSADPELKLREYEASLYASGLGLGPWMTRC